MSQVYSATCQNTTKRQRFEASLPFVAIREAVKATDIAFDSETKKIHAPPQTRKEF